jgi:Leucine-rich repeat (LRR) protein
VPTAQALAAASGKSPLASRADTAAASPIKVVERVLNFPANQSIGEILIESEDDADYWESLAPAKGAVKLPSGRHIQFELSKDSVPALDALTKLSADTFYSIDLSASRISDADLKTIQHFSDLSELDLSDTSVTDEGIKHLSALTKLKKLWLDNTGVTEQGLENLRNLGQLTKVSLIGVKVTEPEVQTLKSKFSNCEIVLQEGKV